MGATAGRYALISVHIEEDTTTAEEVANTLTGGRLCACFTRTLGGDQVDAIAKEMNIADRFIKTNYRSESVVGSDPVVIDTAKVDDGGD